MILLSSLYNSNRKILMPLQFHSQHVNTEVNPTNIFQITGYSLSNFYEIMGISGAWGVKKLNIINGEYPEVYISVSTPDFDITRRFNFEDRTIENVFFEIIDKANRSQGWGIEIFSSQVEAATDFGFNKITVSAAGSLASLDAWNGYITWGKFGFTMTPKHQAKFDILMRKHGRTEIDLNELLSTNEGLSFWVQNGKEWQGEFSLLDPSENRNILYEYMKKKGLL
jgi:hypothetical protein